MSTQINKLKKESIKSFNERSIVTQGEYVNNHRHMPHYLDGLKPSYRRMIWTALEHPDKLVKVATLSGVCGGKYSPHSADSLPSVVSEMVHTGVFDGQGSHGSSSIYKLWNNDPAAPRYIEAKLSSPYRKMLSALIPFVSFKESEVDPTYKEPIYIPTPVPLCLLSGCLGLGVGIRSLTPNFSAKSMIEAYKKNDYKLLKPNGDLELINAKSDLKDLWEKGKGKVTYRFHLTKNVTYQGLKGVTLHGDARFIQLSSMGKLETKVSKMEGKEDTLGWIDQGHVVMIDQSSRKTGKKIFFGVVPPNKSRKGSVTLKELEGEIDSLRSVTVNYNLAATDATTTKIMSLRNWIKCSYDTFGILVLKYQSSQLKKLKLKKEVLLHSERVAKYLLANPNSEKEKIATSLKIDEEVVEECLKKSISVLMSTNKLREDKNLDSEIEKVSNITPEFFYEDLIN